MTTLRAIGILLTAILRQILGWTIQAYLRTVTALAAMIPAILPAVRPAILPAARPRAAPHPAVPVEGEETRKPVLLYLQKILLLAAGGFLSFILTDRSA